MVINYMKELKNLNIYVSIVEKKFRSIADLTSNGLRCPKNPNGTRHYPAL